MKPKVENDANVVHSAALRTDRLSRTRQWTRNVVGSVTPCRTIAAQIVPVTRSVRYVHMPKQNV